MSPTTTLPASPPAPPGPSGAPQALHPSPTVAPLATPPPREAERRQLTVRFCPLGHLGFEEVVFPEHHFEPDGYIPNPIPMMTAVALKTKKMLVGADLFRLPDWHPVRLAEDVAMVDILSNGRVLFKAGAGGLYPPISSGLGWNPRRQLSRSTETMQIVLKCWTEEVFDWEGQHYRLNGVRVMPKPVQKPHPPIFMPAMNAKSIERNVCEGYGANMAGGRWILEREDLGWWKQWHQEWVKALALYGRTKEACPVSVFMPLFCTDDPEGAWAKYKDGILHVTHAYAMLRDEPLLPRTPEELPHWDKVFLTPIGWCICCWNFSRERPPTTCCSGMSSQA